MAIAIAFGFGSGVELSSVVQGRAFSYLDRACYSESSLDPFLRTFEDMQRDRGSANLLSLSHTLLIYYLD